jgi:hypothetical protein
MAMVATIARLCACIMLLCQGDVVDWYTSTLSQKLH